MKRILKLISLVLIVSAIASLIRLAITINYEQENQNTYRASFSQQFANLNNSAFIDASQLTANDVLNKQLAVTSSTTKAMGESMVNTGLSAISTRVPFGTVLFPLLDAEDNSSEEYTLKDLSNDKVISRKIKLDVSEEVQLELLYNGQSMIFDTHESDIFRTSKPPTRVGSTLYILSQVNDVGVASISDGVLVGVNKGNTQLMIQANNQILLYYVTVK